MDGLGTARFATFVAVGVCAVAGVAWWLHPDPSILTTEHLFAFLIGGAVVSWPRPAASATMRGKLVSSPRQNLTMTN